MKTKMTRLVSAILSFVMVLGMVPAFTLPAKAAAGDVYYKLVTSTDKLTTNGEYIIASGTNVFWGNGTTIDKKSGTRPENNTQYLQLSQSDAAACELTLGTGYTLKTAGNQYLNLTLDGNWPYYHVSLGNNSQNLTVSFNTSGNAVISNTAKSSYLQYSGNSFSATYSTPTTIQLYKKLTTDSVTVNVGETVKKTQADVNNKPNTINILDTAIADAEVTGEDATYQNSYPSGTPSSGSTVVIGNPDGTKYLAVANNTLTTVSNRDDATVWTFEDSALKTTINNTTYYLNTAYDSSAPSLTTSDDTDWAYSTNYGFYRTSGVSPNYYNYIYFNGSDVAM